MPTPSGSFDRALIGLVNLSVPQYDGMSSVQSWPLALETRAAKDLLRNGYVLLTASHDLEEFNTITHLLSGGVEKLLRLALGLQHLRDRKGWPSHLSGYKHKIRAMNTRFLNQAKLDVHATPDHIRMIEAVEQDAVWNALLVALHDYGIGGRFYYQDELANKAVSSEHPINGWLEVMEAAASRANADPADLKYLDAVHHQVEVAFLSWWSLVSNLARDGVMGRRAVKWGDEISPYPLLGLDESFTS